MELIIVSLAVTVNIPITRADEYRFPVSKAQAEFYYDKAGHHLSIIKAQEYDQEWIADATVRFKVWDWLDDCKRLHPRDDRACLRKLLLIRIFIGPGNYNLGIMPDPFPTQRFVDR